MTLEVAERVRFTHAADHFRLASTELASTREVERPGRGSTAPETFLLLPGFAQNRAAFLSGDVPRALVARGARVFVGELRGHGRSVLLPGGRRSWSLRDHLALDLPALIDLALEVTGAERLHLVGHSMGGMLAVAALATGLRPRLASVTTFATPLSFHAHSWLVRLAARVVGPPLRVASWGRLASSVRMDVFLGTLAPLLIAPGEGKSVAGLRQVALTRLRTLLAFAALASERTADAEMLAEILVGSDRESAPVLCELAEMAVRGRASIAGIDLLETFTASTAPIASVLSARDVLAPARSLSARGAAAGPRLVVEIEDALHVDLAVGRHAAELVDRLWSFLVSA